MANHRPHRVTLVAAQHVEKAGTSVRVIDLRTIIPYDWAMIARKMEAVYRTFLRPGAAIAQ